MYRAKKILTIFYKHRRGGHCVRLYLMMEALLDAGYEVHYVAVEPLRIASREKLVAHILKLPVKRSRGTWFWFCFSIAAPWKMFWLVLREKISLIIVFDTYYAVISQMASLLTRTPMILFLRAVPWRVNQILISSFLRRWWSYAQDVVGLFAAKQIVAVTTAMKRELETKFPVLKKRFITLANAVLFPAVLLQDGKQNGKVSKEKWEQWLQDFPQRKRQVSDTYRVTEKNLLLSTSGELTTRKNVEHLVRAVGSLENEKISLIICGDGPERGKITANIIGYGLQSQVVLAGWLEDSAQVVAGCDLLVITSYYEGMSNSMLEAMGAGVAVIAADTPEMREVLKYDELLFSPDNVDQLAEKIESIATKKGELERLRYLSRQRAQQYTFNWGLEVVQLVEANLQL